MGDAPDMAPHAGEISFKEQQTEEIPTAVAMALTEAP